MAGQFYGSGNGIHSPEISCAITSSPSAGELLPGEGRRELPDHPGSPFSWGM